MSFLVSPSSHLQRLYLQRIPSNSDAAFFASFTTAPVRQPFSRIDFSTLSAIYGVDVRRQCPSNHQRKPSGLQEYMKPRDRQKTQEEIPGQLEQSCIFIDVRA